MSVALPSPNSLLICVAGLSALSSAASVAVILHAWRRQIADGKRIRVLAAHIEGLKRGGTSDLVSRFVIKLPR